MTVENDNPIFQESLFWRLFWQSYVTIAKLRRHFKPSAWMTVEDGAKNQLWAATRVKADVVSGAYYEPIGIAGREGGHAIKGKLEKELWDWTETQLEGCNERSLNRCRSIICYSIDEMNQPRSPALTLIHNPGLGERRSRVLISNTNSRACCLELNVGG